MAGRFARGRAAIDYFFELSLFLFVCTGFVTAAATRKLDLPTVVMVAAALGLRLLSFLGLTQFSLSATTVNRLTLAYFFFYVVDYFFISRAFVDATAHVVFFVLVMKLFSARTNRDYLYLALLAFLQMLLAAIMTIDTSFLAFFLVFLVFGIATFSSYEIRRAYQRAGNPADVAGTPMMRGLSLMSAVVSVGILLVAALVFFTIPRVSTGYLSRFAPRQQNIAGFSDSVALGEIGQIKKASTIVLRARFRAEPPHVQQLRWRGVALTHFDGARWSNLRNSVVVLPGYQTQTPETVSNYGNTMEAGLLNFNLRRIEYDKTPHKWIFYTVLLEATSSNYLFLIPIPQNVIGRFRDLDKDSHDSVMLRYRTVAAMRYDAVSDIATPDVQRLRKDSTYPAQVSGNRISVYLQLPEELDPRIRALAKQATANATNAYDRARQVEEYLRSNYGYTLDPPNMGVNPLAGFLFDQKRGHCEYFASSMAIMLRTLGIPSRIVNGFLTGEYNDISGMYVVRESEAHSWVEAYFPSYGWLTFDPTPAAGQAAAAIPRLDMWLDALQTFWIDWVVNYDFNRQFMLGRNLDRASRTATLRTQRYVHARYHALLAFLQDVQRRFRSNAMLSPLLIALVIVLAFLYAAWRPLVTMLRSGRSVARSNAGRATPRDATLAYMRLLETLSRRGYRKSEGMSAREFVPVVRDPLLSPLVARFTSVYEQARFGNKPGLVPKLYGLLSEVQRMPRADRQASETRRR